MREGIRQRSRRVAVLGALAIALIVPAGAYAQARVFAVVGGAVDGSGREGGHATTVWYESYDYAGPPVPTADGGFLFTNPEDGWVGRVALDGRWSRVAGRLNAYGVGPRGNGGPARRATLRQPIAIATRPDGSVLIADKHDDRVRRVSTEGVITTVAGNGKFSGPLGDGGPAIEARVPFPGALAVLRDGGFLVSAGDRVRRVGPDGMIATFAGTGRSGFTGDGGPATRARIVADALAVQPDGGVLIGGRTRVRRVSAAGTISTVAGNGKARTSGDGGPATAAGIANVNGLYALPDGGFLIADAHAERIREVDAGGTITTILGPSAFRDFAARTTYTGGFTGVPASVAQTPDGLLMHHDDAILYVATGAPLRPAIRITGTRLRAHRLTITADSTLAGSVTVRLRRHQRQVAESTPAPRPAGPSQVITNTGRRSGPHVVRVQLQAGTGVATDDVTLFLGGRITRTAVREILNDRLGDGDESYYYGPYRCRRFGPRRVDCQIAELFIRLRPPHDIYKVQCVTVMTVRLGRDGLLHQRRYRCPRPGQPLFRPHPRYRTKSAVLPILTAD